ncbi:MAG TPA: Hsp20/alpha crystallin family protein [Opitutaceae bacterium]|nr:Hsp20/alpha crystallin family protein [Opitutaceae bacterium]
MPLFNSLISNFNRTPASRQSEQSSSPSRRPVYDVKETDDAWGVTVHLPGVTKENLSITDEDGTLKIRGERSWKQPAGWTNLYRESSELPFQLELDHDNAIDAEKAVAELNDGVLRLSLPKAESRKPRKIAIA